MANPLAQLAPQLTRMGEGEDDRFEFQLDVYVRGIAALAAASDG